MRELENKEEWRSELGFGEGEQKIWVSSLILAWKIEIVLLSDFFKNNDDVEYCERFKGFGFIYKYFKK